MHATTRGLLARACMAAAGGLGVAGGLPMQCAGGGQFPHLPTVSTECLPDLAAPCVEFSSISSGGKARVASGLDLQGLSRSTLEASPWHLVNVVGGHAGMLSNGEHVLKPMQTGQRGLREAAFYDQVATGPAAAQAPGRFLPAYHGVVHPSDTPSSVAAADGSTITAPPGASWLHLDDITTGMARPCVLDIKLGCVSWSPGSSPRKRAKAVRRYPHQLVTGYRFTGMVVHRDGSPRTTPLPPSALASLREGEGSEVSAAQQGSVTRHRRGFGRALHRANMEVGWKEFLFDGTRVRGELLAPLRAQVGDILAWFETQEEFSFFSSSLLVAYDADDTSGASLTVKLIDFAHVQPREAGSGPDTCTLVGLQNIAAALARLEAAPPAAYAPVPVQCAEASGGGQCEEKGSIVVLGPR